MKDLTISLTKLIANCCTAWSVRSALHSDSLTVTGVFIFPADFPAFTGHFPGKPVLPAIMQLAAVSYLADLAVGENIRPQQYNRAKFKTMVQPGDEIHIELKMDCHESIWTGAFSLRQKNGELVSSGSVQY